jgi:sodium/potassium-transporting ATPase subunit alpha
MWVTECAIGCLEMTPRQAIDRQVTAKSKLESNTAVDQLQSVASLCNAGEFDVTTSNLPLEQRKINADATDQAVLRFAETLGSVAEARAMWIKQFELTFNSKNKFMMSVFSLGKSIGQDTTLTANESDAFAGDKL